MCGQEKTGWYCCIYLHQKSQAQKRVLLSEILSVWMRERKTGRLILIFYQYLGKDLMILPCFGQQEEPAQQHEQQF